MSDEPITHADDDAPAYRSLAQYVQAGSDVVIAAAAVADVYLHRPQKPEEPKPQIELPKGVKRD